MNRGSKQAGVRLGIYLALSFGLTWIWFLITIRSGDVWDEMQQRQSLVALGMLFPVIAHALTRWITKEGFAMTGRDSMMLGISFKDRKWVYYLLALLLPWIYLELGSLITLLADPGCYDPEYYLTFCIDKKALLLFPLSAIISGAVGSFAAFGEEGGWRGYMMPKLFALLPKGPALLIGGVIWGLWHLPLTLIGHNFGTGYPGYPWLGVVCMCVFCTLIGILFTFFTEMSGSVWPAVLLHAINNAGPSILGGYINPDQSKRILGVDSGWFGLLCAVFLLAVVVVVLWKRKSGDKNRR